MSPGSLRKDKLDNSSTKQQLGWPQSTSYYLEYRLELQQETAPQTVCVERGEDVGGAVIKGSCLPQKLLLLLLRSRSKVNRSATLPAAPGWLTWHPKATGSSSGWNQTARPVMKVLAWVWPPRAGPATAIQAGGQRVLTPSSHVTPAVCCLSTTREEGLGKRHLLSAMSGHSVLLQASRDHTP